MANVARQLFAGLRGVGQGCALTYNPVGKQTIHDVEGHAHYITLITHRRTRIFQIGQFCKTVIDKLEYYRHKRGFKLFGYVIMPDHVHLLLLPGNDCKLSDVLRDFKKSTAFSILESLRKQMGRSGLRPDLLSRLQLGSVRKDDQRFAVWQRKYFDFNIYTQEKFSEKLAYVHNNPVAKRLVDNPGDWLYSSYSHYDGGLSLIAMDPL